MAVIALILRGPPNRPTSEATIFRMSDNWWQLCLSCWNRDPCLRPSMLDIVQEIGTMVYPDFFVFLVDHQSM